MKNEHEYTVGVDLGTMDYSAVSIIKTGDPDEVVASATWAPGYISKAFLEIFQLGVLVGKKETTNNG